MTARALAVIKATSSWPAHCARHDQVRLPGLLMVAPDHSGATPDASVLHTKDISLMVLGVLNPG